MTATEYPHRSEMDAEVEDTYLEALVGALAALRVGDKERAERILEAGVDEITEAVSA